MPSILFRTVALVLFISGCEIAQAEPIDRPVIQEKIHRHIEVDSRGRYTETVERISRIMNEFGADRIGRHAISYKSSQQKLKVVDAHITQPDGKVIRLANDWIKHRSGGEDDSRSFSDEKSTVVIFPQVVVGSRLHSKYVLRHFKAEKPGEFSYKLSLSPHMVFEDMQTTLRVPKSFKLLVNHRGYEGGVIHETARYITYQFRIQQLQAHKHEENSIDYEDFSPYLIFTQAPNYLDVGRQYLRGSAPKVRITPEIRQMAERLTKDSLSDEDKAKALYNWVSKSIRYISTTVDDGGLVPRDSAYIFSRRFGDCKDHVVLLEAMLRAVGIESTAALVNMGEAFDFPKGPATNSPINHVITYIPSMDLYLDSTAQLVPFGKLDEQVLDKPTVLVALNRLGHTPKMQAQDNTEISRTELTLLADGRIEGTNNATMSGTLEINTRFERHGELSEPMENTVNQLLLRFNEIGVGKVEVTPSMKTDKPFEWKSTFSLEPIADLRRSGAFTIPVGTTPGYIAEKTLHKPLDKREFPFVCDSVTAEEHVTLNLPETIAVESIPAEVTYQSTHIRYAATYALEGHQLQIKRSLVLDYPSRKCAPELQAEVVEASRVIRADFKGAVVFRTK
jgi:hypothetical protein